MRRPPSAPLTVLVLAFLAPAARAQGDNGFLRGEGCTDLSFGYVRDQYDRFWVGSDKVSDPGVGEVTREAWTFYGAHGLTPDMDVVLQATYGLSESDGAGGFSDESDLQDAVLGVKYRVWSDRMGPGALSFLVAPGVKFPMSDYEDNDVTAIGDGQVDLRGRLIAHWQMDNGFYAALESGYDRRNGAPDDEIPLNVSVGWTLWNQLTISPFFSRVDSRGGIDIPDIPGAGGFPALEEDYTRYGVTAFWRITGELGVSALWRTTDDGRNTGDVDSYGAALVYRL